MRRLHPAEKLNDVLDLLYARRCSGLLSVERFERGRFEEGEIYFEYGCPVYARFNQKTGREAFSRLARWRQVYFAFDKTAPYPISRGASPSPPLPAAKPGHLSLSSSPDEVQQDTLPRLSIVTGLSGPDAEQWIPHRLEVKQNVLALPLTRPQRAVYLLVDGKRTITDLARCIGKSIQDVRRLLNELQKLGLILV